MKNTFKEYFAPIVVLLVICLVASSLLTGTYILTKPVIEAQAAAAASGALAVVLPDGAEFAPMEDVTKVENVTDAQQAGNGAGFVVTAVIGGYGGPVETMVGVNADGTIAGMQVLSHGETPNLGTKAFEESYTSQFIGANSTEGIDVIGGATYSSKAIIGAIDAAILQYQVCNGADYEAPVQLSPEEIFAAALLEVLPGSDSFAIMEGVTLAENALEVHKAANGTGIVVYTESYTGYNTAAPIKAVVGVDVNGAITGVKVLEHGETPGIGTKATEDAAYLNQFIGATQITRKSSGEGTKIDVVGGSTYSSVGVYDAVKAALKQYEAMGGVF